VGIFPHILHGSSEFFKNGLWLAQVPENSPSFLKISFIAMPEKAIAISPTEIRNISIGQSYKKIVILVVLNLIMNIKFYLVLLLIIFATCSCDSNSVGVSDSEIQSASAWNINDQPPTFPQCENLKNKEHLDCFKNIIEVEINSFLNDKVFLVDTSEFILTLKIDTLGKFSLDKFAPSEKLNSVSIDMIKNAVENIPNALPAIKTNVGEFVEVTFNLPFKLNYE
tara:strand:- start:73 stop:744 length:672 start_codon:yes stop_codon:yes gene_type:complete